MSWRGIINSKSKVFLFCLISFVVGIALVQFISIDNFFVFCLILGAVFLLLIFPPPKSQFLPLAKGEVRRECIGDFFRPHPNPPLQTRGGRNAMRGIWMVLLWGVFLLLGMWRYQMSLPDYNNQNKIYFYNNQKVNFTGTIKKVDTRIDGQKLTVATTNFDRGPKISGNVLVSTGLYPDYKYGDQIEVGCKLQKPEKFDDFDYGKYLSRYNIYSACWFADIKKNEQDLSPGTKLISAIHQFKEKLSESLIRSMREPQASIMIAMVLGDRGGIPQGLLDKFSNAGISHIIAISGANITIIITVMMYFLINIGIMRQRSFWLVAVGIIIFMIMIGDQASAVRAAIMGIVFMYAQKIGRPSAPINGIVCAASLMIAVNPKLLLSDIGFQLSFLAVVGLIYITPILKSYVDGWPEFWNIKEAIVTTLAAQIITLPLILFYFHKLSVVALLVNALILPIIPFLTIWGIINSLVGMMSVWLGYVMGFVSWLGISYVMRITDVALKIPFAYLMVGGVNYSGVIIMYGLIVWWIWSKRLYVITQNTL